MAYFKTLRTLTQKEINELKNSENTLHIEERQERTEAYQLGKHIIGAFLVDKDHKNGFERHLIDENGFILIYNHNTKRFITVLSGRPMQIKRYYIDLSLRYGEMVAKAINIAYERNTQNNANYL